MKENDNITSVLRFLIRTKQGKYVNVQNYIDLRQQDYYIPLQQEEYFYNIC